MNTGFSNRYGLLLHSFVNSNLIFLVHLVKLVDAAYAVISKHQGSCFDAELAGFRVLEH